ncbi:hypothetical protein ACHQM5_029033 [Ranunculus cassubicifolius]
MSEDESDYLSDSEENEAPPRGEKVKKVIQFSDIGHLIGPGSIQYASFVGQMARAHCRPIFVDWKVVPDTVKEHIWDTVSDDYELEYKRKVLVLKKSQHILEKLEVQTLNGL